MLGSASECCPTGDSFPAVPRNGLLQHIASNIRPTRIGTSSVMAEPIATLNAKVATFLCSNEIEFSGRGLY